jgi:hypothetical protein
MGDHTTAYDYSTAMGTNTMAINNYSTAMGYYTTGSGESSTAMGNKTIASGIGSTAIGWCTTASGPVSTAMGSYTIADGYYSTALGYQTDAKSYISTALGYQTIASGGTSTAIGALTTARGDISTAMGYNTFANPYASVVIGTLNDTTCSLNGKAYWHPTDPLFIAGNGTFMGRSNALTLLKNGNLIIAGTLTQSSDFRLKENISPFINGSEFVKKINPVYFYFKDQNTHPVGRQIGFIAQEVREVIPELVQEDGQGYLSVDYSKMSVILLQAFKEQQKQLEGQQKQIESAKQENQQLKSEISDLKVLVNGLIANQTAQVNK